MNFSGYVGHAIISCWMSTIASCLVVWLGLRVRFRFSYCSASDCEHTITFLVSKMTYIVPGGTLNSTHSLIILSVVIVTYPVDVS